MKKITKSLIFIILLSIAISPSFAQEEGNFLYKNAQITLFPPVGTNGPDAKECVNKFSLNLLWGVSAGLQGVELGGIANLERDFVKGVQLAGFANITGGNAIGGQLSGFMNVSKNLTGVSGAGFMTISRDVLGLQGSGFMNIATDVTGAQASGFMNIADGVRGAQVTEFMNIAEKVTGAQVSGFMNMSGDTKGAQVAGFMNTADDITGAQVSGFINVADNVRGTQLGFINIADNYEKGIPIGFINIVKRGYHVWEFAGSEIWNLNFGYRLGVDRLFTQFMVGANWDRNSKYWGAGIGIGSRFGITHYLKGTVDLTTYQIIERRHMYAKTPNLLEQLRFTVEGRVFGGLKWFVGPTFNILFVPFEYPEPAFLEHITPWTVYENASGFSYIKMWPGVSGGIRF